MTQTSTLDLDFTAKSTENEKQNSLLEHAEPSDRILQNILNFSKNLEVKQSQLVKSIEVMRS